MGITIVSIPHNTILKIIKGEVLDIQGTGFNYSITDMSTLQEIKTRETGYDRTGIVFNMIF